MRKEYWMKIAILLAIIFIAMMFLPTLADASGKAWTPEHVELSYPMEGWFCLWTDGEFNGCWSCCEEECKEVVTEKVTEKVIETVIVKEPTEKPPTEVPPTEEPTPEPTPEPPKEKCNAGRGNGSEGTPDCDPGNSGKNNGGD